MQQGSHRQAMKDGDEQSGGYTTTRSTMVMPPATMRKGPWTEDEDAQLVRFVRLFGERRWDFLAKVSGLRRTGKSCRLRWVNYLRPGLRRGRITTDEERLILELHGKWGSRWSCIARSLPGRTDNEIKNFWRTRTRKKALEQRRHGHGDGKQTASPSSSSVSSGSSSSPSSSSSSPPVTESSALQERSGDDDAELELEEATTTTAASHHQQQYQEQEHGYGYTMDQLWNEIAAAEAAASYVVDSWGAGGHGAAMELPSSPVWEFCSDYSLWRIDDDEYYKKMLHAS